MQSTNNLKLYIKYRAYEFSKFSLDDDCAVAESE